ncbi:MAG: DLW-39 family protein [Propionibacteriaceae bacterium]
MKWKLVLAAGAIASAAVVVRRRNQRTASQGQTWAAATDPVTPFGDA